MFSSYSIVVLLGLASLAAIDASFDHVGEGMCLDENNRMHDYIVYDMHKMIPLGCLDAMFCGKDDPHWINNLRGVASQYYYDPTGYAFQTGACYCLFDDGTIDDQLKAMIDHDDDTLNDVVGGDAATRWTTGTGPILNLHHNGGNDRLDCYSNRRFLGSTQGDPTIIGLKGQVFKFYGRDGGWYSNIASESLKWNMEFRTFDSCAEDEDTFVSGISLATFDDTQNEWSKILIRTTSQDSTDQIDCEESGAACLGEGSIQISFDGGKKFHSVAGDYHFAHGYRVIAHNTYGACSRKWYDYEISANKSKGGSLRNKNNRRLSIHDSKTHYQYLFDKKEYTINPVECNDWLQERMIKKDIFEQRGEWTTFHIETPLVSFHVEYRRSNPDKLNRKCDFQSLDTWMTRVSPELNEENWEGILGETRKPLFDTVTGEMITSDRAKLLRGKDDADYEVDGPFGVDFNAAVPPTDNYQLHDLVTGIMESFVERIHQEN